MIRALLIDCVIIITQDFTMSKALYRLFFKMGNLASTHHYSASAAFASSISTALRLKRKRP